MLLRAITELLLLVILLRLEDRWRLLVPAFFLRSREGSAFLLQLEARGNYLQVCDECSVGGGDAECMRIEKRGGEKEEKTKTSREYSKKTWPSGKCLYR